MKYFIVDGSLDNFYTAVFMAYNKRDGVITSCKDLQMSFDNDIEDVITDDEKARRVKCKIAEYDAPALNEIMLVLRSCSQAKEQTALEYIRLIMHHKKAVRNMLSLPTVIEMTDIKNKVTGETHQMKGFLRFIENTRGVLYAPYSPDNDITELLAPHFAERFANQKFVIHDVKRKIAAMYDGKQILMCEVNDVELYLSQYEQAFENLWKQYYKSVNITSRPHERQMKGYMPVRYWKFMPEKNDNN
jgi:probable DNA metabolism protein